MECDSKYIKSIRTLILIFSFLIGMVGIVWAEESNSSAMSTTPVQKINREHLITYRLSVMDIKGRHTQALKFLVKNKINLRFQIMAHAKALNLLADDMMRLFLEGSWGKTSRASRTIWDKKGRLSKPFIAQARAMKQEAVKLEKTAAIGTLEDIQKQLVSFESNGCNDCHVQFRKKLEE